MNHLPQPPPFFSEELTVLGGGTVRFRYGVRIADAAADDAPQLAEEVRKALVEQFR